MGHLLYGYKRNEQGITIHRLFDSDLMPEGWTDSPDKIPGANPVPPVAARPRHEVSPEPMPAPVEIKRRRGRPRKQVVEQPHG